MKDPNQKKSRYVNLCFQVHQPRRFRQFQFSEIGSDQGIFNDKLNAAIMKRIADECYLPANRLLLKLIETYPHIKISFSISGSVLDQMIEYAPQVVTSFQALADTGAVEFLSETYFNSLSYFISKEEFKEQVIRHSQKLNQLFGQRPGVFRNTDLIYNDEIGTVVSELGLMGIYVEGTPRLLDTKSPNKLYLHPDKKLVLCPRDFAISDFIGFGYAKDPSVTPDNVISRIGNVASGQFVSLGISYETFGEHKKFSEGIFDFLEGLMTRLAESADIKLTTLENACPSLDKSSVVASKEFSSWADQEKDLSAWLGNELQRVAFESLKKMYKQVKGTGSLKLMNIYRALQTSDHFYYMSTKGMACQKVHDVVSHYDSPYQAFRNYMNILSDFELSVKRYRAKRLELTLN